MPCPPTTGCWFGKSSASGHLRRSLLPPGAQNTPLRIMHHLRVIEVVQQLLERQAILKLQLIVEFQQTPHPLLRARVGA